MRRNILDRLRTNHGGKLVATLERRHVVAMLEKKKPYAQKNWLKTIRGLMLFAIKEKYGADDPTAGLRAAKPPTKSTGHMTWGDEQIAAYRDKHPIGTMARLAIELLLNVAARRGDAHRLGVQHSKNGKLCWRPHKTIRSTAKELKIRILPQLQRAMDAMPPRDTSLASAMRSCSTAVDIDLHLSQAAVATHGHDLGASASCVCQGLASGLARPSAVGDRGQSHRP